MAFANHAAALWSTRACVVTDPVPTRPNPIAASVPSSVGADIVTSMSSAPYGVPSHEGSDDIIGSSRIVVSRFISWRYCVM